MPKKKSTAKTPPKRRAAKTASSQAGDFVREEIDLIRHGAHGARSAKQAIAIGLSKARRAGVKLPPPKKGTVPETTRKQATRELQKAKRGVKKPVSRKRSRAALEALKREGTQSVSKTALSRQSRAAARKRSSADRSRSARKAARTRAATK